MAKKLINLHAEDGANIIDDDTIGTFTVENTSTGAAIIAEQSNAGGPTIAPIRAIMSTASGAFLEFRGNLLSTASMDLAANNTAFMIPVYHGTDSVLGYIAVSKGLN